MTMLKICLILATGAFFIAACSQATTPKANAPANVKTESTPTISRTPPDETTMAKDLYATNCMICHKDSGKGGKITLEGKTINPEDLTADKFKKATDEKLIGYLTNGIEDEGMPAFKNKLTPDEIKTIVKHVRSLQN